MGKTDWKVLLKVKVDGSILDDLKFPNMCPRCLEKTSLTSYKTTWKKEKIEVPICQKCKKESVKKLRMQALVIAGFWTPICWGGFLILLRAGTLGKIMEVLGFPWGLLPPIVLIGTPLYSLYFLARTLLPPAVGIWPVVLEELGNPLAFENKKYVEKFMSVNSQHILSVTNWKTEEKLK